MARDYDPLQIIPSPGVVRKSLLDAERKADRLRTLLRFSEELYELEAGKESGQAIEPPAAPDG